MRAIRATMVVMRPRNPLPALLALSLGYFTMGTIGLAVVGLNVPIGSDLRVAPAHVGFLVTVFALTFAVAAPPAPAVLRRWDRRRALLIGLGLLTVGQALGAASPNHTILFVTRVVGALGAAVYGPAALAAGALIVPEERRQRALTTVFGGMTIAVVLGVPLTSFLGGTLGWRPAFVGVAVLSAVALILVAAFVPRLGTGEPPTVQAYREVLRTPAVPSAVLTTLLVMAAQFTVYGVAGAYLAARFDATAGLIAGALFGFGVVGVVGNASAAWIVEHLGGDHTVTLAVAGLAGAFVALLAVPQASAGLILFALWGFFSQLYQAPQQGRLIALFPDQPGLILALNASALYLGMSLGSMVGSAALPPLGAGPIPIVALLLVVAAGITHATSCRRAGVPATARRI